MRFRAFLWQTVHLACACAFLMINDASYSMIGASDILDKACSQYEDAQPGVCVFTNAGHGFILKDDPSFVPRQQTPPVRASHNGLLRPLNISSCRGLRTALASRPHAFARAAAPCMISP